MIASRPLRIALLTHSTNPRGGVVHALQLAEALQELGHEPVLHAPDPGMSGFFRASRVETVSVPTSDHAPGLLPLVRRRIADYLDYFSDEAIPRFDLFHAQDGISGNALGTLKARGKIGRFARTVHHIDAFEDPALQALQARSIDRADALFVVSHVWQQVLLSDHGRSAAVVGNGVDLRHFTAVENGRETDLRRELLIGDGPVILSVGGVEMRKNTIGILKGFRRIRVQYPSAQLVIAGGATLLDHSDYRRRYDAALAECDLPATAVVETGPIAGDRMAVLYRIADCLAFPSVKEGFGLAVLEAMASGVPVVASRIAPFNEYLGPSDVAWCDPLDAGSIADGMRACLSEPDRRGFIGRGATVAARHDWRRTAEAHLPGYHELTERHYA